MSTSAIQKVFPPMSNPAGNEEFVTYSEFRGFVTETRTGFVHIESKIDWLQNTMNIRFEAVTERFNSVDKRFDDFTANIDKRFNEFSSNINARFDDLNKRFDDANTKSHREFLGIMLGFLSINLVIIGSVVGLIAKTG
jgi:DNA anti-recombination protein RmuC